jgi:hypothetical protein
MGLLPNAEKAIIRLEKLRDYSLDLSHPVGKHKARVFESATGMTQSDAPRLMEMILRAVLLNDVVSSEKTVHGERYAVDFQILGKNDPVTIRTAWIIDVNETIPRLTSCYIRS